MQAKLGLSHKAIPCFDINAACTGLIYALDVAAQMLAGGKFNSALVIGAEVVSKCIDYTDRNTCVLFGDGAGAMILENTNENKSAYFYTASQGDLDKTLYIDKYLHMVNLTKGGSLKKTKIFPFPFFSKIKFHLKTKTLTKFLSM